MCVCVCVRERERERERERKREKGGERTYGKRENKTKVMYLSTAIHLIITRKHIHIIYL